ncbi:MULTISPECIES: hypothetical protein [unclassified Haematospirillum]|uniref:hypothetical protein n=1 Tax=unclassified Haematospirillum TaxID=2622088 RepID=UPI00143A2378|nr:MULTISPECIES: hypothetical protein [unclassified Haematospirillum]NKD55969.1 hypothetical protein [Haematospirillum sp. H4890]NKD75276.1 hypothetical protein [Haematospirillum sp. H4485]NKD88163.1 hypothetical protein [Haematospirillum sp. 15-248]
MAREQSAMEINTRLSGFSRLDFDRNPIRRELRKLGSMVARDARKLVRTRKPSSPGTNPGRQTGALFRSIRSKVGRQGFLVAVAPFRNEELMRKKAYYPAFLLYGAERKPGGRLLPRNNYMADVMQRHRNMVQERLSVVLVQAIVPRRGGSR